jgi:hypothetical protein
MEIEKIRNLRESIKMQQIHMVNHIWDIIWKSGDTKGIPQWRDRNRLHKLDVKLKKESYLLSYKDFQFLDSMYQKYIKI